MVQSSYSNTAAVILFHSSWRWWNIRYYHNYLSVSNSNCEPFSVCLLLESIRHLGQMWLKGHCTEELTELQGAQHLVRDRVTDYLLVEGRQRVQCYPGAQYSWVLSLWWGNSPIDTSFLKRLHLFLSNNGPLLSFHSSEWSVALMI